MYIFCWLLATSTIISQQNSADSIFNSRKALIRNYDSAWYESVAEKLLTEYRKRLNEIQSELDISRNQAKSLILEQELLEIVRKLRGDD